MNPGKDVPTEPTTIELSSTPKESSPKEPHEESGKADNESSTKDPNNDEKDSEDEQQTFSKLQLATITTGLCLCAFIAALDIVILATAIPKITTEFQSLGHVGWYGSSYLLTQTALQPSFGKIYDYFNTKWTFLCGILAFKAGSVVCALANSSELLIFGRAVTGVAAAALFSGGMNIIALMVPLKRRAPYIALVSSMLGVANAVGPLLGGALTDLVGWRWCFWINLPCGAIAFVIILVFLKEPQNTHSDMGIKDRLAAIDILGAVLLLSGLTCLLIGIEWGGKKYPWSDSKVWGFFLGFGIIFILFCILQWKRGDRATIPPRLMLRQRTIFSGSLFACFLSMGSYIHAYYLPIYFQAVKGASAEESGLNVIPYQVSNTIASIGTGFLVGALGWYVPFIWLGSMVFVVGSGLLYTLNVDSNTATLIGYQVLTGMGFGGSVQLPYIAAQVVTNKSDISSANAIMLFSHCIGPTISLGIGNNIFLSTLRRVLATNIPHINSTSIIEAGPTSFRSTTPEAWLPVVLEAYRNSVSNTFILSILTGIVAFLFSLMLEWKTVNGKSSPVG